MHLVVAGLPVLSTGIIVTCGCCVCSIATKFGTSGYVILIKFLMFVFTQCGAFQYFHTLYLSGLKSDRETRYKIHQF